MWTRVAVGFFMDYYGIPFIKTNMPANPWILDVSNCVAHIPGTGDEILTLTYTYDVARAVILMLDLDEWDDYTLIAGEDICFNRMLSLAEAARGT